MNPELALVIPATSACNRASTERLAVAAEIRPIAPRQHQPMADEFLEPGRHTEELTDDRRQSVSIADVSNQCADMKQLCQVRYRVAVPQRSRCEANECADVGEIVILAGAIAVDVGLCLGPCAVGQRDKSMLKKVEEPAQRRIAGVTQTMAHVLGDVNRQGTIGTKQNEQPYLEARRNPLFSEPHRRQRRGRKREVRILPYPDRLVGGTERCSPARLVIVQTFEPPHRLIKIITIRFPGQVRQKCYSVGLVPQFGVHRLISPRLCERSTISVTEFIDTYRAKWRSSTAPSRKALPPSNAISSISTVTSSPRPNAIGPRIGKRLTTRRTPTDWMPSI